MTLGACANLTGAESFLRPAWSADRRAIRADFPLYSFGCPIARRAGQDVRTER
jgi:hypothetical protein